MYASTLIDATSRFSGSRHNEELIARTGVTNSMLTGLVRQRLQRGFGHVHHCSQIASVVHQSLCERRDFSTSHLDALAGCYGHVLVCIGGHCHKMGISLF